MEISLPFFIVAFKETEEMREQFPVFEARLCGCICKHTFEFCVEKTLLLAPERQRWK